MDRYDDFNEFMLCLLEEVKRKGGRDIDYWLGATSVSLGATVASGLVGRLGMAAAGSVGAAATGTAIGGVGTSAATGGAVAAIGGSLLASALIPVVGVALAGGAAYVLAKYLAKAKTTRGKKIASDLETAKMLFEEYQERHSLGLIDTERKRVLIDRLYNKLLSGADLI